MVVLPRLISSLTSRRCQRLDDHIAHDDVDGDHRQEDGDDGLGHQDGAVLGLGLLGFGVGNG